MTVDTGKTGIMLCGHGSRDPAAMVEFEQVVTGLKAKLPGYPIEGGYLEFAQPDIRQGFENLTARGVARILALPAMLVAASHVKKDLPSEIRQFAAAHPAITMHFGRALSLGPKILRAAAERIADAETKAGSAVPRSETLLLVISRGTADPEANAMLTKETQRLGQEMGFARTESGFSGIASPLIEPALRHAATLGFRRIILFPYFLFTGILVKRVYAAADQLAADCPYIEIVKAGYFRDHPLVLDCFAEQATQIASP
jgi:sirohydrochlorin cobaltochelatase